jgi:hypothetical protein
MSIKKAITVEKLIEELKQYPLHWTVGIYKEELDKIEENEVSMYITGAHIYDEGEVELSIEP